MNVSRLFRAAYWVALHIKAYGIARGLVIAVRRRIFARGVYMLRVPGSDRRVSLRAKTSDEAVFDQVFLKREYAELTKLKSPAVEVVFDIGANIGLSAVYFAEQFPQALIVSVEPEESNFRMLQENVKSLPNVRAVHAAIWPESMPLHIRDPDVRHWSFKVDERPNEHNVRVRGVSPSDLMREYGVHRISLFKCDVEGAERELFSGGNLEWIRRVGVFALEFHERYAPGCSRAFYEAISPLNYRQYLSGENVLVYIDGDADDKFDGK